MFFGGRTNCVFPSGFSCRLFHSGGGGEGGGRGKGGGYRHSAVRPIFAQNVPKTNLPKLR